MSETSDAIHFPIDTGDQAYIANRQSLLAREVYEQIARHLHSALAKAERIWQNGDANAPECDAFDRYRSHEAVLLDGGRGTGKSSVLVNLPRYFDEVADLSDKLLILKPVDPTLLENGDDLFLNVIVAALLRDARVRAALRNHSSGTDEFYDELQKLGSALEGIQKIGSEYGLDKLQAFVENQELAEHVHRFFWRALQLTGKKVIVLPIDDVDTSLELAFENVEVVRKYLTSPLVIPIISGDLNLYDDVIYRQFARRVMDIGGRDREGALQQARHLAEEYERKVLPLPRRIRLPTLRSYLDNPDIYLVEHGQELIALPLLKHWLEALINDRVNGEENSVRELPLSTVREFAQFVQSSRTLLPSLKTFFDNNEVADDGPQSAVMMKRRLFMSTAVAQAVALFAQDFETAFSIRRDDTRAQRTARERAYRDLRDNIVNVDSEPYYGMSVLRKEWNRALAGYAVHQRTWGSTYLIADAGLHLLHARGDVLGHDLFRPQRHGAKQYAHFDEGVEFATTWRHILEKKAPEDWLSRLPRTTLLSYPGPETGRRINPQPAAGYEFPLALAQKLLVHWSYYSSTGRSDLLLCGRVFEVLVASLTCDLTSAEMTRIFHRPPFYSLAEFARTKTLDAGVATTDEDAQALQHAAPAISADEEAGFNADVADLVSQINAWRTRVQLAPPNAWFVFVVMNKFFSQVPYINQDGGLHGPSLEVLNLAMQAFNLFWSTVGSFEKGAIFGLPQVVATVNMSGSSKNFEHHPLYTQNIAPFLQLRGDTGYYDFGTGSYTFALESHPLRALWQAALSNIQENGDRRTASESQALATRGLTAEVDKRIDRYVNEVRRQLGITLSAQGIEASTETELMQMLAIVEQRCSRDPLTKERFAALRYATNLPKNSGRRRLQRIMEKLDR